MGKKVDILVQVLTQISKLTHAVRISQAVVQLGGVAQLHPQLLDFCGLLLTFLCQLLQVLVLALDVVLKAENLVF